MQYATQQNRHWPTQNFTPPKQSRDTRVEVWELDGGIGTFICISLSSRSDTQLIAVETTTGSLRYYPCRGIHDFPSESDARWYATQGGSLPIRTLARGRALLGYAAFSALAVILLATRLRTSVRSLPSGKDVIYTVTESQWVKVPLKGVMVAVGVGAGGSGGPAAKAEAKAIGELMELSLADTHYICETRDLSRPFPSPAYPWQPDQEFIWNQRLAAPLHALGLHRHCCPLLQVRV